MIRQLEATLGAADAVWTLDPDGHDVGFRIVRFPSSRVPGAMLFATEGLNVHLLAGDENLVVRQELLMAVDASQAEQTAAPSVLFAIGDSMVRAHRALKRGEALGPGLALMAETPMVGLFVEPPTFLPDADHVQVASDGGNVSLVWLLPVTASELRLIETHGWQTFEDALVRSSVDVMNLRRSEVVLEA